MANNSAIAGYVEVGDHVNMGAFIGIHQFCKIGSYSFLGRAAKIYQDILPYMIVRGNPGQPFGVNVVGLRRNGFSSSAITALRRAYKVLYRQSLMLKEAIAELELMAKQHPEIANLVKAIEQSTRGIAR